MSLEKENTKKRKKTPLSNSEAAWFVFFPTGFFKLDRFKSIDFNESEIDRYKKYGFERKLRQAEEMKKYGRFFYIALAIIFAYFSTQYLS